MKVYHLFLSYKLFLTVKLAELHTMPSIKYFYDTVGRKTGKNSKLFTI